MVTDSGMDDTPVDVADIVNTVNDPRIQLALNASRPNPGSIPAKYADEYGRGIEDLKKFAAKGGQYDPAELAANLAKAGSFGNGDTPPSGFTAPAAATVRIAAQSSAVRNAADPLAQARGVYNQLMDMTPHVLEAMGLASTTEQAQATIAQEALLRAGQAAGRSASAAAETTIATEVKHKQILDAYGLDVTDPDSRIRTLIQQQDEASTAKDVLRQKLISLRSVSFFEDPLQYIMNLPEIDRTSMQHNALVDKENETGAKIAGFQAANAQSQATTPANTADLLRAKASADADVALANAQVHVAQSKAAIASGDAKMALDQYNLTQHQFVNTEALAKATEVTFQANERLKLKQDKEEQEKVGEALANYVNTARTMIAGPNVTPMTGGDIKAMSPADRAEWERAKISGTFGTSYAESVPFINRYGNPAGAAASGNASMMVTTRAIDNEAKSLATDYRNKARTAGQVVPAEKDALAAAYQQLFERDSQFVKPGNDKRELALSKSPLAIDYDATLANAAANGLAPDNAVVGALAKFRELQPTRPLKGLLTDVQIMDAIVSSATSGKIKPADAATQVAEYYSAVPKDIWRRNGMAYLGVPQSTDYSVSMGQAGKSMVDLSSSTAVERYITSEVIKAKTHNMFGPTPANLFK